MKKYQPSRWDRFLAGIAPQWGLRRIQAKSVLRSMGRSYEAAASGRRTSGWSRNGSDANVANARALPRLRELSRELRRNNGWARRGIKAISNSTVGWGIQAKPVARSRKLAATAGQVWREWSESTSCDYDGRLPFSGIQRLVMETVVESGEALVVRHAASARDGLSVPVKVRVVEPDFLDDSHDTTVASSGNTISQGIEFDSQGRRVAYHLYDEHPGSAMLGGISSTRYPADRVIHVYYVERPGQSRGVPWLASAIARLNDLDEFEDAALLQQKIAACFGAFVRDLDGLGTRIGGQDEDDTDDELEVIEPGMIQHLPQGKEISFATPPQPTPSGFSAGVLRRIAAGLGITYEQLTGDYSMVNFSSARMGRLEHWANVYDWRWNMLIPQLCGGVWNWVMSDAAALNNWPRTPTAKWGPPPPPMLEPDKEGLAYQRQIRAGIKTYPQVVRELGYDYDHHVSEIAESNRTLDQLGIILDSDPRKTSTSGGAQPNAFDDAGSGATDGDPDDALAD